MKKQPARQIKRNNYQENHFKKIGYVSSVKSFLMGRGTIPLTSETNSSLELTEKYSSSVFIP